MLALYSGRCGGGRGGGDCRDEGYRCRKVMAAQHTATNLVAYVQNCRFGQLAKLLPLKTVMLHSCKIRYCTARQYSTLQGSARVVWCTNLGRVVSQITHCCFARSERRLMTANASCRISQPVNSLSCNSLTTRLVLK